MGVAQTMSYASTVLFQELNYVQNEEDSQIIGWLCWSIGENLQAFVYQVNAQFFSREHRAKALEHASVIYDNKHRELKDSAQLVVLYWKDHAVVFEQGFNSVLRRESESAMAENFRLHPSYAKLGSAAFKIRSSHERWRKSTGDLDLQNVEYILGMQHKDFLVNWESKRSTVIWLTRDKENGFLRKSIFKARPFVSKYRDRLDITLFR